MKKTSADDSAEAAAALLMMNTASADSSSTGKAFRPSSLSDARAAGCEIPIGSAAVYGNRVIPHENDILNGRGNGVNSHPGNVQFRTFVAAFKRRYVGGGIAVKREVTKHVLSLIRSLDPPGRFLKQNPLTDAWEELDEETSFKKTSQALREKAPALRKQYMLIPNAADVATDKETSIEPMDTTSNEEKLPEKKPQPEEKTPEVIYSSPEKKIKSSSKSAKEAAAAAKKSSYTRL